MYRIVLNETSYYGAGCRSVIADEIRKRGFKKVLLVTDKDLIRFGVAAKIEEVLRGADIPYEIYSQIKANPTIRNVQQGVEAFKASGADCMVALGGGSSIDTAKAVGIIVNNGIVLVDYINQQRLAGMERREAIIDAGVTRLRPILMTSLTTILGLVVTALAKNAGTALIQPIALVCIGGLLYATLMTLFVVPCMYDMMNKKDMQKVDESELQIVDI